MLERQCPHRAFSSLRTASLQRKLTHYLLLFRRVLLVRAGGDRKSLPNGPILKQAGKALPEGKSLLTEAGIFPESRGRVFPLGLSPFSSTPMGWAPCHLSNLAPFLAAKWRLTMHVASSRRVAYSAGSELSLETVTRSCSAGVLTGAIGGDEDVVATAKCHPTLCVNISPRRTTLRSGVPPLTYNCCQYAPGSPRAIGSGGFCPRKDRQAQEG